MGLLDIFWNSQQESRIEKLEKLVLQQQEIIKIHQDIINLHNQQIEELKKFIEKNEK